MFRKIAYFLCFIDETPQISWSNIAFIGLLIKILIAAQTDWPSLVTLSLACLNLIHERHVNVNTVPDVKTLSEQLESLENKISPILDKVKTVI